MEIDRGNLDSSHAACGTVLYYEYRILVYNYLPLWIVAADSFRTCMTAQGGCYFQAVLFCDRSSISFHGCNLSLLWCSTNYYSYYNSVCCTIILILSVVVLSIAYI